MPARALEYYGIQWNIIKYIIKIDSIKAHLPKPVPSHDLLIAELIKTALGPPNAHIARCFALWDKPPTWQIPAPQPSPRLQGPANTMEYHGIL